MPGRAHAESKPRVWWSTVARPVADSPVSISLLQSRHGKHSPFWQPTVSCLSVYCSLVSGSRLSRPISGRGGPADRRVRRGPRRRRRA